MTSAWSEYQPCCCVNGCHRWRASRSWMRPSLTRGATLERCPAEPPPRNQPDLRARNARTFERLPQSCMLHQVRERFLRAVIEGPLAVVRRADLEPRPSLRSPSRRERSARSGRAPPPARPAAARASPTRRRSALPQAAPANAALSDRSRHRGVRAPLFAMSSERRASRASTKRATSVSVAGPLGEADLVEPCRELRRAGPGPPVPVSASKVFTRLRTISRSPGAALVS